MNLRTGHLFAGGRYKVERVLGQGGFGITYLCEQTGLQRNVAVKEFFMREYCERDNDTDTIIIGSSGSHDIVERFRQKFIKEARTLAAFNHKHIVRIIDVFEENNTAYYVMEYVGGGSLNDKVKEGALLEVEAVRYIRQVATALEFVHSKHMMHLDIKPSNILLNENDEAVLIDFGLAKQYDATGSQTSTTPVGISHGYAPLEQYRQGGVGTFSPATDIYSLGATLYKLLTGETPPEAGDINDDGLPALPQGVSATTRHAIETAMQPRRKDRSQSIGEFLALLDGNGNMKTENIKEETSNDGATVLNVVISGDKPSTTCPDGHEESLSDDGETTFEDVKDPGNEVAEGVEERKEPHADDKKDADRNIRTLMSALVICLIVALLCIKLCNDRKPTGAEQYTTTIAEQQRIETEHNAQERADNIAAEQQQREQELLAEETATMTEQERIEADLKKTPASEKIERKVKEERIAQDAVGSRDDKKLSGRTKTLLVNEAENSKENNQLQLLNGQLELANFIKSYMVQNRNKEIIPANIGIAATNIDTLICDYNIKLLQRNMLAANSSENNPVVKDYDKDIEAMHASIKAAINSYIKELEKQIKDENREIE